MNYLLFVKAPRPRGAVSDPSGVGQLLIIAFLLFWVIKIIRKYTKKY